MTLKDIRERTNQSQVTVAKELGWARTKYNRTIKRIPNQTISKIKGTN